LLSYNGVGSPLISFITRFVWLSHPSHSKRTGGTHLQEAEN
jgi:hypothetical protein